MNPDDERSNANPDELSIGFVDQPVTPTGGQNAVNWRRPSFFAAGVVVVALLAGSAYFGFAPRYSVPSNVERVSTPTPTPVLSPASTTARFTFACPNKRTYSSLKEALKEADNVCVLDLSRRNLAKVPPEVLKLRNLETLYLNFNKLTSFPVELAELKDLKLIDLTGNPLREQDDVNTDRIEQLFPRTKILFLRPMDLP